MAPRASLASLHRKEPAQKRAASLDAIVRIQPDAATARTLPAIPPDEIDKIRMGE